MVRDSNKIMNNYYDVLNITPDASKTDIFESYQKLQKLFAKDNIAIYGLFSDEMLEEKTQEIELAYQLLSDSKKRKAYDKELKDRGIIPLTSREGIIPEVTIRKPDEEGRTEEEKSTPARKSPGVITKEHYSKKYRGYYKEYSGRVLAKIRNDNKISLDELYEETKIKTKFLVAIEEESYEELPPTPYLIGFLKAYADYFSLPEDEVVNTYLLRYDSWKNKE